MAKSEVEEVTHKAIANGGILAKLYFDMQSEKQEDLQPLMADLINNRLLKLPGVIYCFGAIDEPIKIESTYTTNAIVTALFKDLGALINASFQFTPAAVEIMKPEHEYTLKISEMQSIVLDLSRLSVDYSKFILEKVMSPEDFKKVEDFIKSRENLGKKIIEKKDGKE